MDAIALLINQLIDSALWSLVAQQIGHHVAKSIATIMNLFPSLASGRGPNISSPQTLNGSGSGTELMVGCGALVRVCFLQTVHFLSTSTMSCLRLGQHVTSLSVMYKLLALVWPSIQ